MCALPVSTIILNEYCHRSCGYNFILQNAQISQTYCLRGATNVPSDVRTVQNVENSIKVGGFHYVQSDIMARSAAPFLQSGKHLVPVTIFTPHDKTKTLCCCRHDFTP